MADRLDSLLVDTGPLIAFLDRNDQHHEWVKAQLAQCKGPLVTCESVLSECVFLLKRQGLPITGLAEMLRREGLAVAAPDYADRIPDLLDKYQDLPTSLADASLVALSEACPRAPLLTFDGDFKVYRRRDRTMIPLRIPARRTALP